jgi:hypothetical protein
VPSGYLAFPLNKKINHLKFPQSFFFFVGKILSWQRYRKHLALCPADYYVIAGFDAH